MEPGQQPNQRLRRQRRLRGWSQDDVATGLHRLAAGLGEPEPGVDATMVGRWERGTRRPRSHYVRLLCCLFELPAGELGIEDGDVTVPPDPLRGLLSAAVLAVPGPQAAGEELWERLASSLRRPTRLDGETVDHLERVTVALESLEPTGVDAVALLGPVTGHLDAITRLLRGSPPALRSRLCSLAGETAGLAGWLHRDLGDQAGAAGLFRTGLDAALEAGDRPLAVHLAGSAACQPPHLEDPAARLRQLRDAGAGFGWAEATAATRVWLAAKEADGCALLGDAGGCLRALERAEAVLCREGCAGESRRPRFSVVDETWLGGERGASLARLGMTAQARAILGGVLDRLGPGRRRDRLWLSAALAGAYVRDAEPEEACRLAAEALDDAVRIRYEPVVQLVQGLCRDLAPYRGTAAVRELEERLQTGTSARLPGAPGSLAAG